MDKLMVQMSERKISSLPTRMYAITQADTKDENETLYSL
jgi:hypothetical protein